MAMFSISVDVGCEWSSKDILLLVTIMTPPRVGSPGLTVRFFLRMCSAVDEIGYDDCVDLMLYEEVLEFWFFVLYAGYIP